MAISILDKVCFLLDKAKSKDCSDSDLQRIKSYAQEFSDNMVLGRVFGYSIGAYALATLKWIDSTISKKEFDSLYRELTLSQKEEVNELIPKKIYLQY